MALVAVINLMIVFKTRFCFFGILILGRNLKYNYSYSLFEGEISKKINLPDFFLKPFILNVEPFFKAQTRDRSIFSNLKAERLFKSYF